MKFYLYNLLFLAAIFEIRCQNACQKAGGACKFAGSCQGYLYEKEPNLCDEQPPRNIKCCIPKSVTSQPFNEVQLAHRLDQVLLVLSQAHQVHELNQVLQVLLKLQVLAHRRDLVPQALLKLQVLVHRRDLVLQARLKPQAHQVHHPNLVHLLLLRKQVHRAHPSNHLLLVLRVLHGNLLLDQPKSKARPVLLVLLALPLRAHLANLLPNLLSILVLQNPLLQLPLSQ
uniref:Secreted protein n=1 Tax=Acrobeloides nanus TaxID=290746 RepID=A0A914EKT6_9BILA